ncbi:MAG: zinc ribbon domain-containing protein [Acidobacteriota bacterium]
MNCPKCAALSEAGALECLRCGVVFAKLAHRAASAAPLAALTLPHDEPAIVLAPVHAGTRHEQIVFALIRPAVLAGLAVWTWQFARIGGAVMESVLHLPDLVFHEAGHVLLGIFGHFIGVLGGSLFQFALPLILAVVFLKQRDQFGAAVCTWWAGQNLLDLAPYISDARALQLVLLGGKTGAEVEGHDWEYLLTELGWLHLDHTLGLAAYWLGLAMMIGALVWGALHVARHPGQPPALEPTD